MPESLKDDSPPCPASSSQPLHPPNSAERPVGGSSLAPDTTYMPVGPVNTGNHDDVHEDSVYSEDDGDSAFGGSLIGCDTDTLASYMVNYRSENGRQYHAFGDGEYWVTYQLYCR